MSMKDQLSVIISLAFHLKACIKDYKFYILKFLIWAICDMFD